MEPEIRIRTAEPEDAAALVRIYAPYVERTAISFEYEVPTVETFRERIRHTLKRYPYLVAEKQGEAQGYAYAGTFISRRAYDWSAELSIYIDMEKRRNGIGRKLYEAMEEILKRQGILNLNACIAHPEDGDEYVTMDSIRFHEKMGYRLAGRFEKSGYKFCRWYDMVWMEKLIGEHRKEQPEVVPFEKLCLK